MCRSVLFDPDVHDVSRFESGSAEQDHWLVHQAALMATRGLARTWVWTDSRNRVLAYYALSAHQVAREALTSRLGCGNPPAIPAILLGRLALHRNLQGQGLGTLLVLDALKRIVKAAAIVGTRLVVVDAADRSVVSFYQRIGFSLIPGQLRLTMRVSEITAELT